MACMSFIAPSMTSQASAHIMHDVAHISQV